MGVSTEEMRIIADSPERDDGLAALLRSAADELEELRERPTRHEFNDLIDNCYDLDVKLDAERVAHEATKRELEAEREAHGCAIKLNNELGIELGDTRNHLNALAEKWATTCARLESAERMLRIHHGVGEHSIESCLVCAHFARFGTGGGT